VKSHLPYEGKLVLDIKAAENAAVRLPKWVDMSSVSVSGGSGIVSGNTVLLMGLAKGQQVTITFPVKTWTRTYTLKWNPGDATHTCVTPPGGWSAGKNMFAITFRGYTAVDIAPAAANAALPAGLGFYNRSGMTGAAPVKTAELYAPYRTLLTIFEGVPPEITAEDSGSTATTRIAGFFSFKKRPAPVMVPPVPTQQTRISTLPPVSAQISGPVAA